MTGSITRLAFGAALTFSGMLLPLPSAHAASDIDQAKARIGFEIAPVPLKLDNRNHADKLVVGYGSYLVNAQACRE